MAEVASAYVSLLPSARGFGSKLDGEIGGDLKASGKKAGAVFGKLFAAGAGLVAAAGIKSLVTGSISAASDLAESQSKVGVVFGKSADQVVTASKRSAQAMGLSQEAYLGATGTLGNLLVSLKIAPKAAANMSQRMVKLAGDLASFNNTSPEEALDALRSGLVGETEPLKRFGVNMNEAALKAQALKDGLISSTKEALTPQAKALAAQALIMEQTATAQGDFGRTSDGLANQQRILAAQVDNVQAKFGKLLLPVVTSFVHTINSDVLPSVKSFATGMKTGEGAGGQFVDFLVSARTALSSTADFIKRNSDVLVPLVAVIGTGAIVLKTITTATKAWAAAQGILNVVLAANPITIVVVAAAALAAGLVVAYKRSDTFRSVVDRSFSAVKSAAKSLGDTFKVAFAAIGVAIDAVGKAGTWLWNKALQPAIKFIVNGVAGLMDIWADMLGVLGKVPGFGWAKEASKAMADAAKTARDVADGIKKIPTRKDVKVTVSYQYKGLRSGTRSTNPADDILPRLSDPKGPQRAFNQILKEYGAAGRRLMTQIETGIRTAKPKTVAAAQDAFDALKSKLESKRDDLRSTLQGFQDDFAAIKEAVSSAFTGDLFGVSATDGKTVGQNFVENLMGKKSELTSLLSSFKTLQGWGISPAFLTQLFSSGNGALITELAGMGQAGATSAANLFGEVTNLSNQLGNAVATNDPVASRIDETNRLLGTVVDALSYLGSDIGKELNQAASKARRDKKGRGKK